MLQTASKEPQKNDEAAANIVQAASTNAFTMLNGWPQHNSGAESSKADKSTLTNTARNAAADCLAQPQFKQISSKCGVSKLALRVNQGGLAIMADRETITNSDLLSDRIPILLVF